jgi:hypothetical protein
MSDSYRPHDVRLLVERVEEIIDAAKYGDPLTAAVKCITEVMNLPTVAEGCHFQGFRADDIEDIVLHLGAYKTVTWDTPGQMVTGTYYGIRTVGWKYKTSYGWIVTNGDEGSTFVSLPDGLREKLRRVQDGGAVTITYVGRRERKKTFTVEPVEARS